MYFHLKQILQNIAGNAVKYNQKGGSIVLSCKKTSCKDGIATYRFVCEDTGIGMSEEFIPHVFEPFAQEAGMNEHLSKPINVDKMIEVFKKCLLKQDVTIKVRCNDQNKMQREEIFYDRK